MQQIMLCADDFGIESGVDEAIVELARHHRLSATSCLTMAPGFALRASRLKALPIDLGLHLNFTESLGDQGLYMPLPRLIMQAYSRRLAPEVIRRQIEQQLDAFEQQLGQAPAFVDGHLHVHQLPVIRAQLIRVLKQRYSRTMPWLRDTRPGALSNALPFMQRVKAHVIGALGAAQLSKAAGYIDSGTNTGFFGAYDFSRPHPPYVVMLDAWLSQIRQGALIMTHPAKYVSKEDAFGQDRVEEFRVLESEVFAALLEQYQLRVCRFAELNAGS
jgi:predicted glycoside hydrolase/deacetylase ChbG (UPF0249 family)